jgi:hypothetical protein
MNNRNKCELALKQNTELPNHSQFLSFIILFVSIKVSTENLQKSFIVLSTTKRIYQYFSQIVTATQFVKNKVFVAFFN